MRLFDPALYEKVHLLFLLVLTLFYCYYLQSKNANKLLNDKNKRWTVFFYTAAFIIVVGFRPISPVFGDTVNYAKTFSNFSIRPERIITSRDSLFYLFMWGCSQIMNVNWFFFIVEILYSYCIGI